MIGLPGLRNRKVVAQRSAGELDAMAAAGSLVASALLAVRQAAAPGVSTLALDEIAESVIRDGGGIPSFLGYHGFPASICSSVNDRVVHGIPSASRDIGAGGSGIDRLRRDPRRLARRLSGHVRHRDPDPRRRSAVAGHPCGDGGRNRRHVARQPTYRRLARHRGRNARGRGALRPQIRHCRWIRRSRHRPPDAHGPVPAQ